MTTTERLPAARTGRAHEGAAVPNEDDLDADWMYEIGLDGDVCDAMRRSHPTAQVTAAGTSTILWARLQGPEDLHVLLDALADFGLAPQEVHESARGSYRRSGSDPGGPGRHPTAVLRGSDFPAGWGRRHCTTWAGHTGWCGRRWFDCARHNPICGSSSHRWRGSPESTTC